MQISARHWLAALTAALLLHVGIGAALLWQAPVTGAQSAGVGGIEISLGPAGGAPGSVAADAPDAVEAEAVTPAEAPQEVEPVEAALTTPPPDMATPDVIPPEPLETIEPETAQAVEAAAAEAVPVETPPVEAVPPEPLEPAEPEVAPTVEAEVVEAAPPEEAPPEETVAQAIVAPPLPRRSPRPNEPPQQVAQAEPTPAPEAPLEPAPTNVETAAVNPSAPGAGGRSGVQASPNAGDANDTSGGGRPGAAADYMAQLQAWLEKHKEYPRRAQLRRQQGTALLYFVMDRDGQVIEYRLEESSGYELLDREVSAMIERAQPLPKMPDDLREARLELVVPVQFFLR
ncbi:MAG: TonB family protein [Kiloniellales bacterium]